MIIEARCNDCGKRIGYISLQGDTEGLKDTKYVKKISHRDTTLALICDKCRDGRIELEGEHE